MFFGISQDVLRFLGEHWKSRLDGSTAGGPWSHWWSHWSFLSDHGWEGELVEAGHKQRSNSFLSSPSACVGNALKTSVSSHVEFLLQAMILKPWHGYSVSVRRVSRVSCRTASMPRIYMIMVAAALSTAAARL